MRARILNLYGGLVIADYCVILAGSDFDCAVDPAVSPGFVADSQASDNRVVDNVITGNGGNADPENPFAVFAADLALVTEADHGNCYSGNQFDTIVSTLGVLPECEPPR